MHSHPATDAQGTTGTFVPRPAPQLEQAGVAPERLHYELFAPNDWLLPG